MRLAGFCLIALACCSIAGGQATSSNDYTLALSEHRGRLKWSAADFKITQNSAKPNGQEIGVRGSNSNGRLTFLGFLFLVPEQAPLTSAKCRDGVLQQVVKSNPATKIIKTSDVKGAGSLPVTVTTLTSPGRGGSTYIVRGFVATGDICGDLEFYSSDPITEEDPIVKKVFSSFQLDADYVPGFADVAMYAEVLFKTQAFQAAAPIFEKALAMVPESGAPFPSAKIARRTMRDQAGMSYGISGQTAKARSIFERGVAEDPDYPMYYYNLACADAGEKKLSDARTHLQLAFARKANVNPGEKMPIPTQDDSFTPFQADKSFWTFLEKLEADK